MAWGFYKKAKENLAKGAKWMGDKLTGFVRDLSKKLDPNTAFEAFPMEHNPKVSAALNAGFDIADTLLGGKNRGARVIDAFFG